LQFEKEYASDGSLDDDELENASNISADSEPPLLNAREDFDAVMSGFIQLELVGNKLAPSLEGDTPTDKLDTVRKALVVDNDAARRQALLDRAYVDDTRVPMPVDIDAEKERWDCETILSESSGRAIILQPSSVKPTFHLSSYLLQSRESPALFTPKTETLNKKDCTG